jgi:hypothetical protein
MATERGQDLHAFRRTPTSIGTWRGSSRSPTLDDFALWPHLALPISSLFFHWSAGRPSTVRTESRV